MVIFILAASILFLYIYKPSLPILDGFTKPTVNLNNPPLDVKYSITDRTLDVNESINLNISVKNSGKQAITDIKINLKSKTDLYTVSSLKKTDETDSSISVTGQDILLQSVKNGEEKNISLSINFNRQNTSNRVFILESKISYLLNGQEYQATHDLEEIYIKATLSANAATYYTSPQGDQLGIGPLPPIVGIPTKYWIFWSLSPTADFQDLSLSAKLPVGVRMTGEEAILSGELSYHPDTRLIIWKLDKATTGENSYAKFELELIPQEDQVGEVITLLESGRIFATDQLTGEDVSASFSKQTTNLDFDKFNSGHGEVMPQ